MKKNQKVIDAIRAVTKASERTIVDTRDAIDLGITPLPGTIQYSIATCWRMAEQLGLVDDKAEED